MVESKPFNYSRLTEANPSINQTVSRPQTRHFAENRLSSYRWVIVTIMSMLVFAWAFNAFSMQPITKQKVVEMKLSPTVYSYYVSGLGYLSVLWAVFVMYLFKRYSLKVPMTICCVVLVFGMWFQLISFGHQHHYHYWPFVVSAIFSLMAEVFFVVAYGAWATMWFPLD